LGEPFLLSNHFVIFESMEELSMIWMLFVSLSCLIIPAQVNADAAQVSAGLDARALSTDPLWGAGEEGANLHGAFFNLRQVISDEKGDRYIFVAQLDANDNLEELEAYQVYAQLKGSLGRASLRAGRYILPFGLLAYFDTERQLLQTQESVALGIKLDTGIQGYRYLGLPVHLIMHCRSHRARANLMMKTVTNCWWPG